MHFELDRRIVEANDAFLSIVGYSRDDVISGRLKLYRFDATRMGRSRRNRLLTDLVSHRNLGDLTRRIFSGKTAAVFRSLWWGQLR